jgi:hypothetical protein
MSSTSQLTGIIREADPDAMPFGMTKADENKCEPHQPYVPSILPFTLLSPDSTFKEIHTFLWFLRASYEIYSTDSDNDILSPWLLMVKPIGFVNVAEKKNWRDVKDYQHFHCFSSFYSEPITDKKGYDNGHKKIRIGFFCTKSATDVGRAEHWSDIPWHCWFAVLTPIKEKDGITSAGYRVTIFDPNIQPCPRNNKYGYCHYSDLLDMQYRFLQYLEKTKKLLIRQVWAIGSRNGNPDGECLQIAMTMLFELLSEWDKDYPHGIEFMRNVGALKVKMTDEGRREPVPGDEDRLAVPEGWESPLTRRSHSASGSGTSTPATRGLSPGLPMERRKRKLRKRVSNLSSVLAAEEAAAETSGLTDRDAPFEEVSFTDQLDAALQEHIEEENSRLE